MASSTNSNDVTQLSPGDNFAEQHKKHQQVDVAKLNSVFAKRKDAAAATQEESPDFMSVLALMFGMISLMTKYRVFSLNSLVCYVMWLANMKSADRDIKQLMSTSMVVLFGIFMAYKRDFQF